MSELNPIEVAIANLVNTARSAGFARGRRLDTLNEDIAEDRARDELRDLLNRRAPSAEQQQQESVADAEKLSRMNADLCDFFRRWVSDGDYLRCAKCKRAHIASKADQQFVHAYGCKATETAEDYPWQVLIRLLRPLYTHQQPQAQGEPIIIDMDRMEYAYKLLPDDIKRHLSIHMLVELRKAINLTFVPTPGSEQPRAAVPDDRYANANDALQTALDTCMHAIESAYGHLWHVNNEPGTPQPDYSPENAAYAARKILRDLLTHEQRGIAINRIGRELGFYEPPTCAAPAQPVDAQGGA